METYRNEGQYLQVNIQCCDTRNCNYDWESAGGGVTEAPGARSGGDSGRAAANEVGNGASGIRLGFGAVTLVLAVLVGARW